MTAKMEPETRANVLRFLPDPELETALGRKTMMEPAQYS